MLDVLLFLGACLGHFALAVRSHNWWYGSALGRRTIDAIQLLHGLFLVAGLLLFWTMADGFDLLTLFSAVALAPRLFAGYVAVCWLVGFVVLPAITVARLVRRVPALVAIKSQVVDLAAELGCKPIGDGKHRFAARLPWNEVFQLDLSEKTLQPPRLPAAWDGLSILHLSDLHFCGSPARLFHETVIDRCLVWKPDLIALTGDYVDSVAHHDWIEPVLGRLRGSVPVLAILGNHDRWYEPEKLRERLRGLGFRVLTHRWELLEVRGQPLLVVGHEGPWITPPPDLHDAPAGVFRLCLSHTPDNMKWAKQQGVDLMLSGHVHGGQIRLPLFGSIVVPSRHGRRYDCGVFQEGGTILHVSRGVGGEHPLRFNCRPEVTLLRLQRVPSA